MLKEQLEQALTNQQATEAALRMVVETASQTNSALAALGAGLLSISAVGFIWYRRIKLDAKEDAAIERILAESAKAAEMWRINADDANKRAEEASKRADEIQSKALEAIETLSKERNDAVQEVGKLRSTVEHLQKTVERFERENKTLNDKIDKLLAGYGVTA